MAVLCAHRSGKASPGRAIRIKLQVVPEEEIGRTSMQNHALDTASILPNFS
jgi:hypothetical protein